MANWSLPTLTSLYTDFLTYLKSRDVDASTMFVSAPTNPPTGAMKYVRASNKFQEWDGAAWNDKVLSVAGGGTGGSTAAAARTALGLGSMATQDNSAVNITGGTITGVTISVTSLSGTIPLANGGTGASLVLGANGAVLQSTGSAVSFALLVNQNIDNAAAIAWSKISKVTSSLADLATRSASDLSSGTLPDARFPATLPAVNGSALTNLNASAVASGSLSESRLGKIITGLDTKTDGTYTAATDLIVTISVNSSGVGSCVSEGRTVECNGFGQAPQSASLPVRKGASYTLTSNGNATFYLTALGN